MNNIETQILKNQATILNILVTSIKKDRLATEDIVSVYNRMNETRDVLEKKNE